jgi:hypothetical protein
LCAHLSLEGFVQDRDRARNCQAEVWIGQQGLPLQEGLPALADVELDLAPSPSARFAAAPTEE